MNNIRTLFEKNSWCKKSRKKTTSRVGYTPVNSPWYSTQPLTWMFSIKSHGTDRSFKSWFHRPPSSMFRVFEKRLPYNTDVYVRRTWCEKGIGKNMENHGNVLGNLTNNLGLVVPPKKVSLVWHRSLVLLKAGSRFRVSQHKNRTWPILMNYQNQFSIFAYFRYHYSFVQSGRFPHLSGACFWRDHGICSENSQRIFPFNSSK